MSCWRSAVLDASLGQLLESRLRATEGHGDQGTSHGNELEAPRRSSMTASGTARATTAIRMPTPATRTPGRSHAPRVAARQGTARRLHGRQHRRQLRLAARRRREPSSSSHNSQPLFDEFKITVSDHWTEVESVASTSGRAIHGRRARTPTGRWGSTRSSPGWRRSGRETAISPESTLRRTPRATSTAPSRPASASSTRSSET